MQSQVLAFLLDSPGGVLPLPLTIHLLNFFSPPQIEARLQSVLDEQQERGNVHFHIGRWYLTDRCRQQLEDSPPIAAVLEEDGET